jgi:hypothetical protein
VVNDALLGIIPVTVEYFNLIGEDKLTQILEFRDLGIQEFGDFGILELRDRGLPIPPFANSSIH